MEFLPDDYKAPNMSDNYMKFLDGENKFRILSKPIIGWEDWKDNKPIRYGLKDKPAKPNDSQKPIRHFWAFVVWNYNEEKIQILQITQASIRSSIECFVKDKDFGSPYFYDLKVYRKGEGMNTEYTVMPLGKSPISAGIKHAFDEKPCNLDALMVNADPFVVTDNKFTAGIFEEQKAS